MRIKGKTGQVFAKYDTFELGNETEKYVLKISGPSGNATSPNGFLSHHNNAKFSTYDQDNDNYSGHCSNEFGRTGWWFNNCFNTLLTGNYKFTKRDGDIRWYSNSIQPEYLEMKIRRKV